MVEALNILLYKNYVSPNINWFVFIILIIVVIG